MLVKMEKQILIKAPAAKVWRILAHEFDEISRWSSDLGNSWAAGEGPAPEGTPICGRVCESHGFGGGRIVEVFTYYEEEAMRYGYKGTVLPKWIRSAENNWSVQALDANTAVAAFSAHVNVNPLLAILMLPYFNIIGQRVLQELKFYAEHDQPHPRKIKAVQR